MKEYNLILSRKAKTDIIDIGDYIAYTLLEPEKAYHFVVGLWSAILTLKELYCQCKDNERCKSSYDS